MCLAFPLAFAFGLWRPFILRWLALGCFGKEGVLSTRILLIPVSFLGDLLNIPKL